MPAAWVVCAKITRRDGAKRVDRSAPTTFTAGKKEVTRLERAGAVAWLEEVPQVQRAAPRLVGGGKDGRMAPDRGRS